MTPFGKMKLSLMPERIIHKVWNANEGDLTFDELFESCVIACKEENIDLRSNWSRFYDACKSRKIFWNKEATSFKVPVASTFVSRPVEQATEEDFWKVELAYLTNPAAGKMLNFHNPYAHAMDLATTQYPELYCYYLALFKNHTCRNTYNKMLQKWLLS